MASTTASDPLVPPDHSTQKRPEENAVVHVVGEKSYAIDPSRNKSAPASFLRLATKSLILVTLSPVLAVSSVLFSLSMYIGPQWWRHGVLSVMIPRIMKLQAVRFGPERDTLLADIQESHTVLDVGCGGGAYLRHFTKASRVVALEPVTDMHGKIRQAAREAGISKEKLTILPCTIEEYLEQRDVQEQFDWIILGNVLCEVSNPLSTLASVDRLTKSQGHVYVSEHEGEAPGTWTRRFQNIINPWWVVVSGGCNCNRDTLYMMRSIFTSPQWEVAVWQYPHLRVGMGPSFLALCRKK